MGNPRNIDHLMSDEDIHSFMNPENAHKTMLDIFGSEESRTTIEGKYQHVLDYETRIEKLLNMKFLFR